MTELTQIARHGPKVEGQRTDRNRVWNQFSPFLVLYRKYRMWWNFMNKTYLVHRNQRHRRWLEWLQRKEAVSASRPQQCIAESSALWHRGKPVSHLPNPQTGLIATSLGNGPCQQLVTKSCEPICMHLYDHFFEVTIS